MDYSVEELRELVDELGLDRKGVRKPELRTKILIELSKRANVEEENEERGMGMKEDRLQTAGEVIKEAEKGGTKSFVVVLEKPGNQFFRKPIYIFSEEGASLAGYMNKKQLGRFLNAIGVTLSEYMTRDTVQNGKVTVYKPSKNIHCKTIYSPNQLPNGGFIDTLNGIVGARVVDMYVQVKDDRVVVFKPSIDAINNGFNPSKRKDNSASDFVRENGSVNIVENL